MENFYIIYDHLVYLTAIWYICKLYGPLVCIYWGHLVYFSRIGILYQEKSGNPATNIMSGKRK
jgi:hypothetical protein